jgi:hypothetical protein
MRQIAFVQNSATHPKLTLFINPSQATKRPVDGWDSPYRYLLCLGNTNKNSVTEVEQRIALRPDCWLLLQKDLRASVLYDVCTWKLTSNEEINCNRIYNYSIGSRGSSVGIVSDCGLDGRSSTSDRGRGFFL